ncbi:MAG TPA: hypothetical protein VFP80_12380 [Thermoanaerobaculia bacterium]|nr:hypothetical protein [Thermoanaerobaculia bacterium]
MNRGTQKSPSGTLPALNKITLRKLAVPRVRKDGPIAATGAYPCDSNATCTGTACCFSIPTTWP